MRQNGFFAAAALHGIDHHRGRLAEDHANARRLAEGLAGLPGVRLDPSTVETNIVFFELDGGHAASVVVEHLLEHGVRMGAMGPRTIRAVTHLDVDAGAIDRAVSAAREVFKDAM